MRSHRIRLAGIAAASVATIASPLAGATSAHAANQDGVENSGEFIFFYNSGQAGSRSDFTNSKADLAGYKYLTHNASLGKGQSVNNNSASVRNLHLSKYVVVYRDIGQTGYNDLVPAYSNVQLSNTYNENTSFMFYSTS